MKVIDYTPEYFTSLLDLINGHSHLVPPYAGVRAAFLMDALNGLPPWRIFYPEEIEAHRNARVVLVVNGPRVLAAASWTQDIHWLVTSPDRPEVLALLLDTVIAGARHTGQSSLEFAGRGSFGSGWFGVPRLWPHLLDGLFAAGFTIFESWHLLTLELSSIKAQRAAESNDFELHWTHDSSCGETTLEARSQGIVAGECSVWATPWLYQPNQPVWTGLEWVGVEPPFRHAGLGARLIREQARFQQQRGVHGFVASVETNNEPMLRLAERLGFRRETECCKFTLLF